jgi:hypothetical protein
VTVDGVSVGCGQLVDSVKIAFKLLLTSRYGGGYPSAGAIDLRRRYISSASADFGWQRQIRR